MRLWGDVIFFDGVFVTQLSLFAEWGGLGANYPFLGVFEFSTGFSGEHLARNNRHKVAVKALGVVNRYLEVVVAGQAANAVLGGLGARQVDVGEVAQAVGAVADFVAADFIQAQELTVLSLGGVGPEQAIAADNPKGGYSQRRAEGRPVARRIARLYLIGVLGVGGEVHIQIGLNMAADNSHYCAVASDAIEGNGHIVRGRIPDEVDAGVLDGGSA